MQIKNNDSIISTNSNSSESHEFTIGDVSGIIEILRNKLYSNPIQTLTQEYLSNARDSHRESGNGKTPIKVTLPTNVDSCLKIRDYGVGLNKERVKNVFVNYGISTKRSSNEQTGGFGLGAKSAWAYTDSFVVVSFYEGTKSTYVAHTGNNKNGMFELVEECSTNELNGVEIQIPVKEQDIESFINAVYRTTFFWEVKPKMQGITEIEMPEEYKNFKCAYKNDFVTVIRESAFVQSLFRTNSYRKKLFALIDGIPYDISKYTNISSAGNIVELFNQNLLVFISVNNGEIQVSASREEISNDSQNTDVINQVCRNAINKVSNYVSKSLSKDYENLKEYYDTYDRLYELVYFRNFPNRENLNFSYSLCENCKFTFDFAKSFTSSAFTSIYFYKNKQKRIREHFTKTKKDNIHMDESVCVVINDGDFSENMTTRKIKHLLNSTNKKGVYLLDCQKRFVGQISECLNALFLSNLDYPKGNYSKTSGRVKEKDEVTIRRLFVDHSSYTVKSNGIQTVQINSISDDENQIYIIVPFLTSDCGYVEDGNFKMMLDFINDNPKIAGIFKCGKKDYEKLAELPNVIKYEDIDDFSKVFPISKKEIESMFYNEYKNIIFKLKQNKDKIECPDLKELFDLYPTSRTAPKSSFGRHSSFIEKNYSDLYSSVYKKFEIISNKYEKVIEKYPLLKNVLHYDNGNLIEYVWYINGKYRSIKKTA